MLYSTPEFLLFLAVVLALYFSLGRGQAQRHAILTVASLFFYAWAGVLDFLISSFVILMSWLASWFASRARNRRAKKLFLAGGIALMALHLIFWKYAPWLVSEIQEFHPGFLGGTKLMLPLPIGISFFTLQGIAYLADFYHGEAGYLEFSQFLLFKSFFPQLVAGPIVRLHQLGPQLEKLPEPDSEYLREGLALFARGFFKKIAIADRMASWVDPVFSAPGSYTGGAIVWSCLAYTVQIWGDFSGYTDMGRGAAKMFGIRLPENFFSPYFSRSPSEFWRRWHVTLSEWIRDYIYIPLGGGKGSFLRVAFVALVTMAISGLWHGAALPFLVWGLFHGALLVTERFARKFRIPLFERSWSALPMFLFTVVGWLIFRSSSMGQAVLMLKVIAGAGAGGSETVRYSSVAWGLVCCFLFHVFQYKAFATGSTSLAERWAAWAKARLESASLHPALISCVAGGAVALLFVFTLFIRVGARSQAFIYFQF